MEQQQEELKQCRNIMLFSGHDSYQSEERNTRYSSAGLWLCLISEFTEEQSHLFQLENLINTVTF